MAGTSVSTLAKVGSTSSVLETTYNYVSLGDPVSQLASDSCLVVFGYKNIPELSSLMC